jgi:enterochelin esterase-like enzyme
MLGAHRRMADALAGRGYPLREVSYHGGHDINCWISELPATLRWWADALR